MPHKGGCVTKVFERVDAGLAPGIHGEESDAVLVATLARVAAAFAASTLRGWGRLGSCRLWLRLFRVF